MKIKISTQQVLKFLQLLSWIIFIGLCIDAGGIIFNAIFTHFINPTATKSFWKGINLLSLYTYDSGYFFVTTIFMSIIAVMKALMFYLIVKVLYHKKLDLSKPFNYEMRRFILNLGYLTFGISIFSIWGSGYINWLINKGVKMPALQELNLAGADVWLFMSVTMFVIAQIFKRGIEIQSENDLTV